jgi:hypothetical protein
VSFLGISPREFWNLTWYEWGFYALKMHDLTKKHEQERQHYEDIFLGVTRIMIADFRNAHSSTGNITEPKDVFRLSFEKEVVQERPLTFKEAKILFGSRIRRDVK